MWIERQQVQGDANVQSHKLRHWLQLHPREAFHPQVHVSHPYCLCYYENIKYARDPQGGD
jgi:hypothetical protein